MNILEPEELFSDEITLGRRVNWLNRIKEWTLETPSFFPYFRSTIQGKAVAEFLLQHDNRHVSGIVSSNPQALERIISELKMVKPDYNPLAMIDPQSETLFYSVAERDRKIALEGEGIPEDIIKMIHNKFRKYGGFSSKTSKYNDILSVVYDTTSCAGWLETNIRKQLISGAKIGVPILPLIVDDESRRRWKEVYLALKRLVVEPENIFGEAGIPLALHVPLHQTVFHEKNQQLRDDILKDVEELKPELITIKVADGINLKNEELPEKAQFQKDFLEAIGRLARAFNVPTHLFCENNNGIYAYGLGISTYSQPVDYKPLRKDFFAKEAPTMEQKFGRIYHYGKKVHVTHQTWLTEAERPNHAPCGFECCVGVDLARLKRMAHHEFYRYSWKHLLVTRNQEVNEVIAAIRKSELKMHVEAKYSFSI
jgi:hypothetical protein